MKVLLLNMPFVSLSRPSIGLSILKARLTDEGTTCTIGYPNLFLAERVGFEAYQLIDEKLSQALFAGEWLFAQRLFEAKPEEPTYLATVRHHAGSEENFATYERVRQEIDGFLDACLERYRVDDYDLVGFTSTFQQNIGSLALAKRIKQRWPHILTAMGGANCEGTMGLELSRSFDWMDFIFSGEADHSFPELVKRLDAGKVLDGVAGLIRRRASDGASELAAPQDRIHNLDSLPDPDFSDYFRELRAGPLAARVNPSLLIESARGCWWGAKSHCTFCGLNGETMTFRAKSATRVADELERQSARYDVKRFQAVDNIISYDYFKTLLPMLVERQLGVNLFYEVKSNLKPEQVSLLKKAGVYAIQPGVESLNSHVLKLMRKGVSALQNIQLLKFCRQYGVEPAWNLLYGFPGETPEDYEATAAYIPAIYHLKPPGCASTIRLDRFSPNFDKADEYGLAKVRPFALYNFLYPLPPERVANLAYFFEYEYTDGRKPEQYLARTLDHVKTWKANKSGDLVKQYGESPELMVIDTRPERPQMMYPFNGIQREIYDYCDEIRTRSNILDLVERRFGASDQHEPSLDQFLGQLLDWQLMVREGNQFLSVAVPPVPFQPANPA
jgi:ribosomal peptide maturation radical SAM protein 1